VEVYMENLSIVIKDSIQDNIYNSIKVLTPLLEDGNTQLILINDINNKFNIDYEHIVYEFEEPYEKFLEFCKASSFNNNLMIIEDGMILTEEVIKNVKEILLKHGEVNIKANIKKYYYKENYYIEEIFLVYNSENLKEERINIIIDDFTYFSNMEINISHNISRFIQKGRFEELYSWYKNYIFNVESDKFRFYNYIEKHKINLNYNMRKLIDEYFLFEELDYKYCEYLKLMKSFKENNLSKDYLNSTMKKCDFKESDIYVSYIILECLKRKEFVNEIFVITNQDKLEIFTKYLFDGYKDFNEYVYSFLKSIEVKTEVDKSEEKNILLYVNLIEIYYKNTLTSLMDKENKDKLIGLLIDYSNYGAYLLRKNLIEDEIKKNILIKLEEVQNLINLNQIKMAANNLFRLAEDLDIITLPARFYGQKLLYEAGIYENVFSITMIVKNEEQNLERCLKSLVPLIKNDLAELIIVDTGSNDKTVDIAKKYTDKVYFHEWQGNFSEARNWSMSLAKGEYIFIIDADTEFDRAEIDKYITYFSGEEYKNFNSFSFKARNYEDENNIKFNALTQNNIFKNDGTFHYYGTVHNQPNFKGPVKDLDIMVHHYGYIMDSKEARERKFNRTGYILKKELEKTPFNIYYRYQLMKSYSLYGNHKESLNQAELLLKLLKSNPLNNDYVIYYNSAMIVTFCNKIYDATIEIADIVLSIIPNFIDALYFKAQSLFLQKKYKEAIKYYKYYLNELNNIYNSSVINDVSLEFYSIDSIELAEADIMISYLKLHQYLEFTEYILTKEKGQSLAKYKFGMIKSYINLNKFKELAVFYSECINFSTENDKFEFNYYIKNEIENLSDIKLEELLNEFSQFNISDDYYRLLIKAVEKREKNSLKDIIKFLLNKDMQNISLMMLEKSIYDFIIILINNRDNGLTFSEIIDMRKVIKNILIQILNKKSIEGLSNDQIITIIFKYMDYIFLVYENSRESLLAKEILFLEKILLAFQHMQNKDLLSAVREIKDAALEDEDMANAMAIYVQSII
jgi:Glycosyltransferases involved in cell wall biogenesis